MRFWFTTPQQLINVVDLSNSIENYTRSESVCMKKSQVRLEYRKSDQTSFGNYIKALRR